MTLIEIKGYIIRCDECEYEETIYVDEFGDIDRELNEHLVENRWVIDGDRHICRYCNNSKFRYKKAYNILMDYWDFIPDEDKIDVDKKLKELGL